MFTQLNNQKDQVILVDRHDKKVGEMDKYQAHRDGGHRHRAISVFLFNKEGKLLIQQRSSHKIVGALQWANTCCGNVLPGETRKQCALRRLKKELGIIDVKITSLYTFEYKIKCNEEYSEWEIDEVFTGIYEGAVFPNPDEVEQIAWKHPNEIHKDLDNNRDSVYAPWFVIMMHSGFFERNNDTH